MADVIGPNSYLPGNIMHRDIPEGTVCDIHSDRLAIAEVVGETDSFGSETHHCCQECLDDMKKESPRVGMCDWCKTSKVETKPMRDYEEGMHGRVYEVCKTCRDRYDKQAQADMDRHDLYSDYDPYLDDD